MGGAQHKRTRPKVANHRSDPAAGLLAQALTASKARTGKQEEGTKAGPIRVQSQLPAVHSKGRVHLMAHEALAKSQGDLASG